MKRLLCLLAATALGSNLFACSDDDSTTDVQADDEPEDASTGDPGTDDDDQPANIADSGADSTQTDAGIDISFVGEGVECGDAQCRDVELGGEFSIPVAGCCADEAASQCGLNLEAIGVLVGIQNAGCEPLDLPGSEGAGCEPSEPIQVAVPGAPEDGIVLEPCCQQNGECGFDATFSGIGFGCVAPERFSQESSGDCEFTADN